MNGWMNEWMNKWMKKQMNKSNLIKGFHLKNKIDDLSVVSYKKKLDLLSTGNNSRFGVKLSDRLLSWI